MRQIVAPEMHFLLNILGYKWKIRNCQSIGLSESSGLGTDLGVGVECPTSCRHLFSLHIVKEFLFQIIEKNFNALQRQMVNLCKWFHKYDR